MSPRWTTARAVSRGADFRLRVVDPTSVPSKDRIGIVAASERMESCCCCLGLQRRCFEEWKVVLELVLEKKMVEEKKDKEEEVAIVGVKEQSVKLWIG